MNMQTVFGVVGGGAAIGLIAGCWSQVKAFIAQLRAFFVLTYEVDWELTEATLGYLRRYGKAAPASYYFLESYYMFHKRFCKRSLVAYDSIPHSGSRLFLLGARPLVLSRNNDGKSKISFFRGTIPYTTLIKNILDFHNNMVMQSNTERFFVQDVFGSLEFPETNSRNDKDKNDASSDKPSIANGFSFERKMRAGIYRIVGYDEQDVMFTTSYEQRYMDYLVYPKSVLDAIDEAGIWMKSKDWYRTRGISWKRGWLLHGKPGCGKSALVLALGEKFDLPIYVFHLITMTNTDMVQEWRKMSKNAPCIALFEDIDSVFDGRVNLNKNTVQSVLSFDTLLNCLDGISRSDGVFTIVTTNNVNKLDPALGVPRNVTEKNGSIMSTRPGRVDRAIELLEMDVPCRKKLAEIILRDCLHLCNQTVDEGKSDTGAQFSERCIRVALAHYWKNKGDVHGQQPA